MSPRLGHCISIFYFISKNTIQRMKENQEDFKMKAVIPSIKIEFININQLNDRLLYLTKNWSIQEKQHCLLRNISEIWQPWFSTCEDCQKSNNSTVMMLHFLIIIFFREYYDFVIISHNQLNLWKQIIRFKTKIFVENSPVWQRCS